MHRSLEGPVDVGNRDQDQRDQQREREHLHGVQLDARAGKQARRTDGEHGAGNQHEPQHAGKLASALYLTDAAVRGHVAELGHGVVYGGGLRGIRVLHAQQDVPHALRGVVALEVAYRAGGHGRPVVVDDDVDVVFRGLVELRRLRLWNGVGQAIDIHQRPGLRIGIHFCNAEIRPHGVEHEAEDDGVDRPEDAELPADDVVMGRAPAEAQKR